MQDQLKEMKNQINRSTRAVDQIKLNLSPTSCSPQKEPQTSSWISEPMLPSSVSTPTSAKLSQLCLIISFYPTQPMQHSTQPGQQTTQPVFDMSKHLCLHNTLSLPLLLAYQLCSFQQLRQQFLAANLTTSIQTKWLGLTSSLLALLAECGEPKYMQYYLLYQFWRT